MNETQNDRITALGRKATDTLVYGDEFTHTIYGDCRFIRWTFFASSVAVVYASGDVRFVRLNRAGSVKMLEE